MRIGERKKKRKRAEKVGTCSSSFEKKHENKFFSARAKNIKNGQMSERRYHTGRCQKQTSTETRYTLDLSWF